jgi:lipoate-protein ligase B
VVYLGRTAYQDTLELQRRLHMLRACHEIEDLLLLTEHERVLTLGRKADDRYLRVPREELSGRGIEIIHVERGGDVTYHGPGQLVGYPILDLRRRGGDVHRYIRQLEQTAIDLLRRYGVRGERRPGTPGVWAGPDKIASVGVYVARWVTMHGIAINIAPYLMDFDLIYPCGLVGTRMTSVAARTGTAPQMADAAHDYAAVFSEVFDVWLKEAPLTHIEAAPACAPIVPAGPDPA